MSVAWPDAERVDRLRLESGLIARCPVCGRPAGTEPLPAPEALDRVARHLWEAHDPYFGATLRLRLNARAQDPFYPVEQAQ